MGITNNENLKFYIEGKGVPEEAKSKIEAGILKNYTNINPMWRIKRMTEMFGPIGIGWKIKTVKEEYKENTETHEIACFVSIELYIKNDGVWSEAIEGDGGSMFTVWQNKAIWENKKFLRNEKILTTNDEALKMAKTDALSVCCKMLGIAADVYFEKDRTKYDLQSCEPPTSNDEVAETTKPEQEQEPETAKPKPETENPVDEGLKKADYMKRIKLILWEVADHNKKKSMELLEEKSSYEWDGKKIKGFGNDTSLEKITLKRLQTTYGKLKKEYTDIAEKVKKDIEAAAKKKAG